MTAPHIVDPAGLLGEALSEASPDLMRTLLQSIINALLSADAEAVVGAEWGRPSQDRTAQRRWWSGPDRGRRQQASLINRASTSPVTIAGTGGLSRFLRVMVSSISPPRSA